MLTATLPAERAALLRAILDAPGEDVPRLIFADWLEEYGDGADREQGEFIRVQVALSRLDAELMSAEDCNDEHCPGCTERRCLQRRLEAVWYAPAMGFAGQLPVGWKATIGEFMPDSSCPQAAVRRGFVHTVKLPLQAWLDHGAALVRAHPVERVEATVSPYPCDGVKNGSHYWAKKQVPGSIWRLMKCDDQQHGEAASPCWKRYPCKDVAVEALSTACLLWAKQDS